MSYEEALDRLAADIDQLRIDFERFFQGALAIPPEELRTQIQLRFRRLRTVNLQSAAENFRLSGLEARYNTYNELFNRRLRAHEEGRSSRGSVEAESRFDVARGVVLDNRVETEAVEALYAGLARSAEKGPRFDLETFRGYLRQQVDALHRKTGCQGVQFRLVDEGGKMKLKAKPVSAADPSPEGSTT